VIETFDERSHVRDRAQLRLRIETREEVVEKFGKRRVGKDGVAQLCRKEAIR
jgi:hypothetical protein